ncbi:MAG: BolA/IbaG family iron-sulfur metabolism protein [Deltaproteobacteria bacterium]
MKLDTLGGGAPPIVSQIRDAIAQALPGADVRVTAGQPGHFSVSVRSAQFQNQSRLACQRLVYKAIAPLMSGERAPVHAIDQLETIAS